METGNMDTPRVVDKHITEEPYKVHISRYHRGDKAPYQEFKGSFKDFSEATHAVEQYMLWFDEMADDDFIDMHILRNGRPQES